MRKLCPLLIKPPTLQHPRHSRHRLQASSSFPFMSQLHRRHIRAPISLVIFPPVENESDWSFSRWIRESSHLKFQRLCSFVTLTRSCEIRESSLKLLKARFLSSTKLKTERRLSVCVSLYFYSISEGHTNLLVLVPLFFSVTT